MAPRLAKARALLHDSLQRSGWSKARKGYSRSAQRSAVSRQRQTGLTEVVVETEHRLAAMTRSRAAKSRRDAVLHGLRNPGLARSAAI